MAALKSVRIALYKRKRLLDIGGALIRWWTKSPYSHCELVVDGTCYSSSIRDGGVRSKVIDLHEKHWDVVDLPWADRDRILRVFQFTENEEYGWYDLVARQIFNRPGNAEGWFCSEWCAYALNLNFPQRYSPGGLAEACANIDS